MHRAPPDAERGAVAGAPSEELNHSTEPATNNTGGLRQSGGGGVWPPPSDPMAVARDIAGLWTHGDVVALRYWRGGWMVWKPTGQWVEVERTATSAAIYDALEHALFISGQNVVPWEPNRRKVGDVLDALGAVTFLAETVDAPAWLGTRTARRRERWWP
jgi:hypothetical protein